MSYHPVKCSLSADQAKKLMSGGTIAFKKSQIGHGEHEMYLTSAQRNRLQRGNGMRLRFSGVQSKHNLKNGKGFMDTLKALAKVAAPALLNMGANALKDGNLGTALLTKINPALGATLGPLVDKGIAYGVEKGNDKAQSAIAGNGMKKKGKGLPRKKKGKGFFDDLKSLPKGEYKPRMKGCIPDWSKEDLQNKTGQGLYAPGYGGGGLLPKPIRGVNSCSVGM